MFYAAMYALKGREERRNAAALSQVSYSDLGGRPSGDPACRAQLPPLMQQFLAGLLRCLPRKVKEGG